MADIKVKDLTDTSNIVLDNQIMVLTNDARNQVQNITVSDLLTNVLSDDNDNVLEKGTDGKLYVEKPEAITGELENLATSDKSSLVNAINEVFADSLQNEENIGDLAELETTDKNSIVNAVNEIINATTLGANRDLSNLTNAGEARLHALKGYSDEGELLTDSEGLADVTSYANSTFDISKFTLTGSPVVSASGMVSAPTASDGLSVPFTAIENTDYTIKFSFKTPASFPTSEGGYVLGGNNSFPIELYQNGNGVYAFFYKDANGGSHYVQLQATLTTNTLYDIMLRFNLTTLSLTVGYKLHTASTYTTKTVTMTSLKAFSVLNFLSGTIDGEIDLKSISILEGLEPVFVGAKTGVDTIIDSNYTIVGTPTIAEGVVTGLDASNYLSYTPSFVLTNNDDFEFVTPEFTVNTVATRNSIFLISGQGGNSNALNVGTNANGNILILIQGLAYTDILRYNLPYITGYKYQVRFKHTASSGLYEAYYKVNGSDWTLATSATNTSTTFSTEGQDLTLGRRLTDGSMDINGSYITLNGACVYVPALRIPYVQSSTGSKIVYSSNRDRVKTDYLLNGSSEYYTLSETDFTLPMGELYGFIGKIQEQPHIVETYSNGMSWYRVYSDGWCEQGGATSTADSALTPQNVTLLKSYANTNYTIQITSIDNVQYDAGANWNFSRDAGATSNKSTNGFTINIAFGGRYWETCGYIN